MERDNPAAAWHVEHVYFNRLLDLLQGELELLRAGKRPNYGLMLDVAEYLQVHGDRYHHPREDAAYSFLAYRRDDLKPTLDKLREEHIVIARLGERLLRDLNEAVEGFAISRDDLIAVAGSYLIFYREHIALEETQILGVAESLLQPDDWHSVAQATPPAFDPLFGAPPKQRYRELLERVRL